MFLILSSSFYINAEQIDRNETIKTFKMGLEAYNQGDYASALKYWTPLADQHQPAAQTMIGVMHLLGHGVPKNERKAFTMISEPASLGYAPAQYHLGIMYMGGQGVPKNEQAGLIWFRKSADQGWAPAQYILGSIYANGQGVEKNGREAVLWYRKATEQGFAEAQNDLGLYYAEGRGVIRNIDEARKWLELASKQGHSGAAINLERLKNDKETIKEPLYRPCVGADLLGIWELRDLRIPKDVSSKDVDLAHPELWRYQRWIFSHNGKVSYITSKTPFTSITEKVAELYNTNTPVTYTINDQGVIRFNNMPDISRPYYLACQYVLRDSPYGDRKGELLLSSWKKDKTPLWIKYLRKIK